MVHYATARQYGMQRLSETLADRSRRFGLGKAVDAHLAATWGHARCMFLAGRMWLHARCMRLQAGCMR